MRLVRRWEDFESKGGILTTGFFDGVHLGHRFLLQELVKRAREANKPSVVFTLWPHPRLVLEGEKSPLRLLTDLYSKIARIAELGIDSLFVQRFDLEFANRSAEDFLEQDIFGRINPSCMLVGYDHRYGKGGKGDFALVQQMGEERGVTVEKAPIFDLDGSHVSSTAVRMALLAGDTVEATRLLGRTYELVGSVIPGRGMGRQIGIRTINVEPLDPLMLLPGDGVYAGECAWSDDYGMKHTKRAVISIGVQPTITSSGIQRIEAHLLNFSGDLYGRQVRLGFGEKLRNQERFDSVERLRAQIALDVDRVAHSEG